MKRAISRTRQPASGPPVIDTARASGPRITDGEDSSSPSAPQNDIPKGSSVGSLVSRVGTAFLRAQVFLHVLGGVDAQPLAGAYQPVDANGVVERQVAAELDGDFRVLQRRQVARGQLARSSSSL